MITLVKDDSITRKTAALNKVEKILPTGLLAIVMNRLVVLPRCSSGGPSRPTAEDMQRSTAGIQDTLVQYAVQLDAYDERVVSTQLKEGQTCLALS